jgi:glycerophosphoryl diester phosphodiesterase
MVLTWSLVRLLSLLCWIAVLPGALTLANTAQEGNAAPPKLIAHRGGVVDKTRIENNVDAIEEAIRRNYDMLEVDIRESLDGQLVVHHDANFRRFYSESRAVSDLTWEEIRTLRSDPGGHAPLSFEQFAALCRGRIKLMIDTKGPDHPPVFFERMEQILRENDLLDSAMIIGTPQAKQYFLDKAKVGINLEQLPARIAAGEEVSRRYVLFAHGKDLDAQSVALANSHHVAVVPSVNIFHYPVGSHLAAAAADLLRLRNLGVTYFQIDSIYDPFLRDELPAP